VWERVSSSVSALAKIISFVMPGLVPGIHVFKTGFKQEDVDGRDLSKDALRAFARP
jgi:hypothetical protein